MIDSYLICTSPRSGSTLLCSLLKATGIAGAPGSNFHVPDIADWRRDYGLETLVDIIEQARLKGRGSTPIFGLRLQHQSAS